MRFVATTVEAKENAFCVSILEARMRVGMLLMNTVALPSALTFLRRIKSVPILKNVLAKVLLFLMTLACATNPPLVKAYKSMPLARCPNVVVWNSTFIVEAVLLIREFSVLMLD